MHINKFNSQYTQGKMASPARRSVNLYETQFSKEPDNHGGRFPDHSSYGGNASLSSINPAVSRIESNPFYQGHYLGFGSRDTRLEGSVSEFMRPSNLKYGEHRMQMGQH